MVVDKSIYIYIQIIQQIKSSSIRGEQLLTNQLSLETILKEQMLFEIVLERLLYTNENMKKTIF